MYGGYAKLSGGRVTDCLSDLTGGITQEWDLETLDDAKKRDMELLLVKRPPNSCVKNYSDNCVFGCATGPVNSDLTRAGLVENHAYAIIESRELIVDNRQIIVMLIRNPWGWVNWNGQHSLDWDRLPPANARYMRNKLAENSGGFWLLLDDFVRFFARLETETQKDKNPLASRLKAKRLMNNLTNANE
ncbi:hypothetical protein niasHT_040069 [Heterodera trifolii]|uniref:Calpain catalytic domain-containing protein n=1 Tax=Heterodera trifolii TaxID=157864 RepID=A0ABD2J400_9BILA